MPSKQNFGIFEFELKKSFIRIRRAGEDAAEGAAEQNTSDTRQNLGTIAGGRLSCADYRCGKAKRRILINHPFGFTNNLVFFGGV